MPYVGAMLAMPSSPGAALAVGIQTLSAAQSQQVSVSVPQAKAGSTSGQTNNSAASMSSAPLPTAAPLTAHDAVFSQIEDGSCSVADGLLAGGKAISAANMVTAALDLGKIGVSASTSSAPQCNRTNGRA
jgi:hypothetical protein